MKRKKHESFLAFDKAIEKLTQAENAAERKQILEEDYECVRIKLNIIIFVLLLLNIIIMPGLYHTVKMFLTYAAIKPALQIALCFCIGYAILAAFIFFQIIVQFNKYAPLDRIAWVKEKLKNAKSDEERKEILQRERTRERKKGRIYDVTGIYIGAFSILLTLITIAMLIKHMKLWGLKTPFGILLCSIIFCGVLYITYMMKEISKIIKNKSH